VLQIHFIATLNNSMMLGRDLQCHANLHLILQNRCKNE
jgi:hypothetical protein